MKIKLVLSIFLFIFSAWGMPEAVTMAPTVPSVRMTIREGRFYHEKKNTEKKEIAEETDAASLLAKGKEFCQKGDFRNAAMTWTRTLNIWNVEEDQFYTHIPNRPVR